MGNQMVLVESGDCADTIRREKFGFVQQVPEHGYQMGAVHQRKQTTSPFLPLRYFDMRPDIRMIVEEPEHAALEAWEVIHKLPFESLNPQKRNQPHQGADLEIAVIAVGQVQNVVVKAVLI